MPPSQICAQQISRDDVEVEKGIKSKKGGSLCYFPYLITFHPLPLCSLTCQTLFPGILIPEGSVWKREHKGILSVIVRSSLNNKHINLIHMATLGCSLIDEGSPQRVAPNVRFGKYNRYPFWFNAYMWLVNLDLSLVSQMCKPVHYGASMAISTGL